MKHIVRTLRRFGCLFLLVGLVQTIALAQSPLRVVVAIEPQAFLVERIGGDRVQVQALIQSGQDPHTFQISPRQVQSIAQADLLFTSRTPFEERLTEKISQAYPNLKIEDMAVGIQRKWSDEHEHADGDAHEEKHQPPPITISPTPADSTSSGTLIATDPHIWLSPRFLRVQAQNISVTLSKSDPSQETLYKKNLQAFLQDLDAVHQRIAQQLTPYRGHSFYVYHPAFGCFAQDYGLVQKAVEIEGKAPTARQLSQLVEQARADRVRVLFSEEQFNQRSPGILAEAIGAQVKPLNPLARDVLKNLDTIARNLEEAFREETP
jgi:zinc transport system substrate-binding protein